MSMHNTTAHQQRLVADQILDRVAHDPAFHQQLLDNTAQALQSAGFTPTLDADDVAGYASPLAKPCTGTCGTWTCGKAWTCGPWTCKGWTCSGYTAKTKA